MWQVLLLGPQSVRCVLDYPSYKIGGGNVIKLVRGGGEGGGGSRVSRVVQLYMWPLVSNEGDTGSEYCHSTHYTLHQYSHRETCCSLLQ